MNNYKLNGFVKELEKTAGFGSIIGSQFKKLLPTLAIATGIGVGIEGVRETADFIKRKKIQNEVDASYDIVIKDPVIQELMVADPKITKEKIKGAFGVLAKFAPSLAATPEVARPFVRHAILAGGGDIDHGTISGLAATNANIMKMPKMDFADRIFGGGSNVMKASVLPGGKDADWYSDK